MDSIHDMGGMHGFGAIVTAEPEDAHFHVPWHGRMFALTRALRSALPYGGDQTRQEIERTDPTWYLAQGHSGDGYYSKWFHGHFCMLKQLGVASDAELDGGAVQPLPPNLATVKPLAAADALGFLMGGAPGLKPDTASGRRFKPGDRVRTLRHGSEGHTRLPRFTRDKIGTVAVSHGRFNLADAVAAGQPRAEPAYTVVFAARELWGPEAGPADTVALDLWESYLGAEA